MLAAARADERTVPAEDEVRAQHYQLLARFLAAPPDAALLQLSAGLGGNETELGTAVGELARRARETPVEVASREYHDLFIGLARGELVPYASYYLTGFLNEKPLAKLRVDMSRLGIARAAEVKEPEDHVAALCEMMAGLILGWFRPPLDLVGQRAFFDAHLRAWVGRFFEDLEAAASARLYRPLGTLGRTFVTIEEAAFDMV
ncbi:MAG TPA: molecular chaperone TorD family protein [Geminicoccaceae bacterium]